MMMKGAEKKELTVCRVPIDPGLYLRAALELYPAKNAQRTQARKVCDGVMRLAEKLAREAEEARS